MTQYRTVAAITCLMVTAFCNVTASRPNILFIIADDQSPLDLKTYNAESPLESPVLDRLAAEGMVFDGAYHMGSWSGAVCTPSRHMIMSGRALWHIPRHGYKGERTPPPVPPGLAANTMAAVFNRAGYDTMRTCKKGKQNQVRDVLYGAYCGDTKPGMRCVRKGDWKLIKVDVLDGKVRETQLFNLAQNPHELLKEHHDATVADLTGNQPQPHQVDLAEDPRYAAKREEMEALLLSEQKRHHDPFRFWDQPQD